MMTRFALPLILIALVFGPCSKKPPENHNQINPDHNQSDLRRETVENGIEVTFYPTYGYREGADWGIRMHGWVHKNRESAAQSIKQLGKTTFRCVGREGDVLKLRLRDFFDRDINRQRVEIQFD